MVENQEFSKECSSLSSSAVLIPDHELVRLIGRGSYGEVWLARNAFGTYRAVKVIYEKTFRDKRPFEREYNGVKKFEPISRLHEGLVDVLQVGRNEKEGYFYYVMELADDVVSGERIEPEKYAPRTLACHLAAPKLLEVTECQRIGNQMAGALDFLHSRGLIHRDVKPSNIIFVQGVPKLADIGLVAELSQARSYVGTDGFIPPEGPGTVQSDIYSLGKVLYEISTGKDRHDYPELPTRLGEGRADPKVLELNRIVLKACRVEARQRYRTARAMVEDLSDLEAGRPRRVYRNVQRMLQGRVRLVGIAGLVVVGGVLLLASEKKRAEERPPVNEATNETNDFEIDSVSAPDGLVAWWRGEGNALDYIGSNVGYLVGSVAYTNSLVGQGFYLSGAKECIVVPYSSNLVTSNYTITGWIKPLGRIDDPINQSSIFVQAYGEVQVAVRWGFSGLRMVLLFNTDGYATTEIVSAAEIPLGKFSHYAGTWDGKTLRLFINGSLSAQNTPTGLPVDSQGDFYMGGICHSQYEGQFFKGVIDDVRYYGRALTEREIQQIYDHSTKEQRR